MDFGRPEINQNHAGIYVASYGVINSFQSVCSGRSGDGQDVVRRAYSAPTEALNVIKRMFVGVRRPASPSLGHRIADTMIAIQHSAIRREMSGGHLNWRPSKRMYLMGEYDGSRL